MDTSRCFFFLQGTLDRVFLMIKFTVPDSIIITINGVYKNNDPTGKHKGLAYLAILAKYNYSHKKRVTLPVFWASCQEDLISSI